MAGEAGGNARELDQTPTWAVAAVCVVIIIISLLLEKGLHKIGEWLSKKRKIALVEALEIVKSELMILGFISLLLTFAQNYIAQICVPIKVANTMLPCAAKTDTAATNANEGHRRRLLSMEFVYHNLNRRILAAGPTVECAPGKVPLITVNGLHQLHIFIFFLAIFHVVSSALIMGLGRAKIRNWKDWEKETSSPNYEFSNDPSRFRFAHETSFVKQHTSIWNRIIILFYIVSFFRQIFWSVRKTDYLTVRHGFISAHLAPGTKFNFQKYIKRALEDDFKVVFGISSVLWFSAVIVLLLNVHGWMELFWVSIVPLVIILVVGTKLQAIITGMAIEIKERHSVVQGIPLVKPSDHHFWFGRPELILFLIHFTLFQNSFQITYLLWIWYAFGLNSCFHENPRFLIARVVIGVGVQILCSYVTLPLYALVSQMGTHLKKSIFDEHTTKALKKWHQDAKKKHAKGSSHSPSITPPISPRASPFPSPTHVINRYNSSVGHTGKELTSPARRYYSENEISETENGLAMENKRRNKAIEVTEHPIQVEEFEQQSFRFVKITSPNAHGSKV